MKATKKNLKIKLFSKASDNLFLFELKKRQADLKSNETQFKGVIWYRNFKARAFKAHECNNVAILYNAYYVL